MPHCFTDRTQSSAAVVNIFPQQRQQRFSAHLLFQQQTSSYSQGLINLLRLRHSVDVDLSDLSVSWWVLQSNSPPWQQVAPCCFLFFFRRPAYYPMTPIVVGCLFTSACHTRKNGDREKTTCDGAGSDWQWAANAPWSNPAGFSLSTLLNMARLLLWDKETRVSR